MKKILSNQISRCLRSVLSVLILLLLADSFSLTVGQSVTVTTDKDDYFPGQWVIITGSGWIDDDSIRLTLTHIEPLPDPLHFHDPWFVKPNLNGDIYYEWFVFDQEMGTAFNLEALGYPTGNTASTYFTDGSKNDIYPSFITSFTGGNSYCQNERPADLNVSWNTTSCTGTDKGNPNVPVIVTWYRNSVNSTTGGSPVYTDVNPKSSSSSYNPSFPDAGTSYYYVVVSWSAGSNCTGGGQIITTETQTVIIKSAVSGNTIGSLQNLCTGSIPEELKGSLPSGGNGIFTYSWESGTTSNASGFSSAAGNSHDINYQPVALNVTTWFRRVVTSNGCTNFSDPVLISVAPASTASISVETGPICYEGTSVIKFTGPPNGVITYNINGGANMNADLNGGGNVSVSTAPLVSNTIYNLVSVSNGICTTSVSGNATVLIEKVPPVWSTSAGTLNRTVECSNSSALADAQSLIPLATDYCTTTLVPEKRSGTLVSESLCNQSGIITNTFIVRDAAGNQSELYTQLITVVDNTTPTFTRPADTIIYKDAVGKYDVSPSVTGDVIDEADNCSMDIQATWADVEEAGACEGTIVIHRTWSLKDNCGNAAENQIQTITVADNIAPTFTAPSDITIYKEAACKYDSSPLITGDVIDEADNCSMDIQATWADVEEAGACEGTIVIHRTWSLKDKCGNVAASQVQTITVNDNIAPTFTAPSDITIYKDAACKYDSSPLVTGDVTDEADNCSIGIEATWADVEEAGSCEGTIVIHRTWSLKDKCGNVAASQVQKITVIDNLAPIFNSSVPDKSIVDVEYDPSLCGAVFDYTITANDNCNGSETPSLVSGLQSGSVFPFGTTLVAYSAKDNCGNSSTYSFTIRVNPAVTNSELSVISLPASTDPAEQQYSDQVKLKVVVGNGFSICGDDAATAVNFYIGSQLMNAAPVPFKQIGKGKDMMAEITVELLEPASPNGQMAPTGNGMRTVSAKLVNMNTEKYKISHPENKSITIKAEDARSVFSGTSIVATAGATSGSAVVTLRATIQDISALSSDPSYDVYSGDIRNAKIRFLNGTADISGYLTPVLITQADKKTGVVTFTWNVNIGNASDIEYNIYTEISGYYMNPPDLTVVTVYKPTGDFITGGGYIIPYKTEGAYASEKDGNLKTNFGFNVKYNKNGTNLQGNMNFIIRNRENGLVKTYQIKSNAMTSLGVDISKLLEQKAVFVSKANITDISNPLLPVPLGGNLTLQINMTDRGEPGSNDMIGISLWDGSTLLYSNSWNGSSTDQQLLAKGNLVVHSAFSLNASLTTISTAKSVQIVEKKMGIDLKVYPNPFTDHLYFEVNFNAKGRACLEIFDLNGVKLATMIDDDVDENQFYRFEYQTGILSSKTIIYRLSVDGVVISTGRVIHK